MPKDTNKSPYKSPSSSDPNASGKLSDIALRKKKNADAQAAFRARRANYITTLEETVTSLESVVLQLQDSCRESRAEANDLRRENAHLLQEMREREKYWKALLMSRKGQGATPPGEEHQPNDLTPPLPSQTLSTAHNIRVGGASSSYGSLDHYPSNGTTLSASGAYAAAPAATLQPDYSQAAQHSSSSLSSYADDITAGSSSINHHRTTAQKYSPYAYSVPGIDSNGMTTPSASSHSSFTESSAGAIPGSATDLNYMRFPTDQKVPSLHQLDTASYVFQHNANSISPTTSPSSSSTSLTTPFNNQYQPHPPQHYPSANGTHSHNRQEYAYRRSHSAAGDVGLAGTDVSLAGPGSDAVRYRLGLQRPNSGGNVSISPADNGSPRDSADDSHSRSFPLDRRRSDPPSLPPQAPSRSPSPSDTPPLSGTLAVLKAQAFGALRRTRCRTKKNSDGASVSAKAAAMDALEARGISAHGRHRLDDDDDMDFPS